LYTNSTGTNNAAIGYQALVNNTTGTDNIALGNSAGVNITTGTNNICLGSGSGPSSATQTNSVYLGNDSIQHLFCKVNIIETSDARDKTNIVPIIPGLNYITKLNPVSYNFKNDRACTDDSKTCPIKRLGFLAQEVLATEKELNLPFNHTVNTDDPDNLKILSSYFIPILVRAVQELSAKVDSLTTV